ncbi:MAG: hypothetical protein ACE5IY_23730 [bacterium]
MKARARAGRFALAVLAAADEEVARKSKIPIKRTRIIVQRLDIHQKITFLQTMKGQFYPIMHSRLKLAINAAIIMSTWRDDVTVNFQRDSR